MRRFCKILGLAIISGATGNAMAMAQDHDAIVLVQKSIEIPGEFPLESGGMASVSVRVTADGDGDIISLDYNIVELGKILKGEKPKKSCDTCPTKGAQLQFCVIDECPKPGGPRLSVPVLLWANGGLGADQLPEVSVSIIGDPLSESREILNIPVLNGRDWLSAMPEKE